MAANMLPSPPQTRVLAAAAARPGGVLTRADTRDRTITNGIVQTLENKRWITALWTAGGSWNRCTLTPAGAAALAAGRGRAAGAATERG